MPNTPLNNEELRNSLATLISGSAMPSPRSLKKADAVIELLSVDRDAAVREAQDKVIEKSHTPCECGKGHYGAPVRSVQGTITTYCPFSKIVLQSQPNAKEDS